MMRRYRTMLGAGICWLLGIAAAGGVMLEKEALTFDGRNALPAFALRQPLAGTFTVQLKLRLRAWPADGKEEFSRTSPAGVVLLQGRPEAGECLIRVLGKRLQLHLRGSAAKGQGATARAELPLGEWVRLALVHTGAETVLYADGAAVAALPVPPGAGSWSRIAAGQELGGIRLLQGEIRELRVIDRALSAAEVKRAFRESGAESHLPEAREQPPLQLPYPALKVAADVSHPIAGTIARTAEIVPWSGPGARDLLVSGAGRFHGHRVMLYRNLNRDRDGVPVFDSGESIGLAGRDFQALRRPDGGFDLIASGEGTPFPGQLVFYRNTGKPGAPKFGSSLPISVGNRPYCQAFGELAPRGWVIGDLDGDGVPDLVAAAADPEEWNRNAPDGVSFFNGREAENSGPGRGYDIAGKWLGEECRYRFFWAKGEPDGEAFRFGEPKPILARDTVMPLQWKTYPPAPAPALLRLDGVPHLIVAGDVDRLLAMPIFPDGAAMRCGSAADLLRERSMTENYWIESLRAADLDGDGHQELIAAGNPGRITVYRGRRPGDFTEAGSALQRGGLVETDTLVTPARGDWDGDGVPDLITGDASGYLIFWPGTADPLVYGAPVHLRENGCIVHHQAGPSGSIQGYHEKRWGYLQPTIGDWDGDGRNEIVTNDIRGEVKLYRPVAGRPGEVRSEPFLFRGKPLPAAWRVRPAILPARYGFGGENRAVLLFLDWDGDLAAAVPARSGSTEIARIVKLSDASGKPIRLCGVRGHWGRAKLAVSDWDGDGVWDLLWGHNLGVYREIWPKHLSRPKGAVPCLFRNVGSNAAPRFGGLQELEQANGERFHFHTHNSSVFPTDLDGDGREDLIVGAEDGKIYWFGRDGLRIRREPAQER